MGSQLLCAAAMVAVVLAFSGPAGAQTQIADALKTSEAELERGNYREAERILQQARSEALTRTGYSNDDRNRVSLAHAEVQLAFGMFADAQQTLDLRKSFLTEPSDRAAYSLLSAHAARGLAQYDAALAGYAETVQLAGEASRLGAAARSGTGQVYRLQARTAQAIETLAKALDAQRAAAAPVRDIAGTLATLGDAYFDREELASARKYYLEASTLFGSAKPLQQPALARALTGLAEIALLEGKLSEAADLLKRADLLSADLAASAAAFSVQDARGRLAIESNDLRAARNDLQAAIGLLGKDHPDMARGLETLARVDIAEGNPAAAVPRLQESERIRRTVFGPQHPQRAGALHWLGVAYAHSGRTPEALEALAEAMKIRGSIAGPASLAVAGTAIEYAEALAASSKSAEAAKLFASALDVTTKRLGPAHALRLNALRGLGIALYRSGGREQAEPLLREWIASRGKSLPAENRDLLLVRRALAGIALENGKYAEAGAAYAGLLKAAGAASKHELQLGLADANYGLAKYAEAAALYEAAIKLAPQPPAHAWRRLGRSYLLQKRYAEAVQPLDRALALYSKQPGSEDIVIAVSLDKGEALLESTTGAAAEPYLRPWLGWKAKSAGTLSSDELRIVNKMVQRLLAAGQSGAAEPYLRQMLNTMDRQKLTGSEVDAVVVQLADACRAQNKPVDAAQLYFRRARRELSASKPEEARKYLASARELLEKRGEAGDPLLIRVLQAAGETHLAQRNAAEAAKLFDQSRTMLAAAGTRDPVLLAAALNGLGMAAQMQGELEPAAASYLQAQDLLRSGNAPPALLASVLYNRGSIELSNSRVKEAGELYGQWFELAAKMDESPAPEHIQGIADYYLRQGQPAEAEKLYRQVIDIRRNLYGEKHREYAVGLQMLASFYNAQKQYGQAADYGARALRVFEAASGADSEDVTIALGSLATTHRLAGRLKEVVDVQTRVLSIREKSGQLDKTGRHIILNDLASAYRELKDYRNALARYNDVLQLWAPEGVKSVNYRGAMRSLAVTTVYVDPKKAEAMFKSLRQQLRDPREQKQLLTQYARALHEAGREKEALRIDQELKSLESSGAVPRD